MAAHRRGKEDRARDEVPKGPRAIWSGTITFGLVSVPVELFPGVRSITPTLRMLTPDGAPLSRRYRCPEHDTDLSRDDLVRGYPLGDGSHVPLTDDELESVAPRRSRDIELRRFVPVGDLDEFLFERPYVLTPSTDTTKPYRLLARIMEEDEKAGIGTFVMRNKEHFVAIVAEKGVLMAQTMRFVASVRSPEDVGLSAGESAPRELVKEFGKAIDANAREEIDRDEMTDERTARLLSLIERKGRAGEDIIEAPEALEEEWEEADGDSGDGEGPPDLFEVIRGRLAAGEGVRRSASPPGDSLDSLTKGELYERARDLDVKGRSSMTKDQLVDALRRV